MKHIRETTTSTDLLIESGETDRPPGHFLVDCSCGEEYYVRPEEYGPKVTEFEALELARREHAVRVEQAPNGPLYNLWYLYRGLKAQDIRKMTLGTPGTMSLQGIVHVVQDAFVKLFDRVEKLEGELANVRESSAAAKKQLEIELSTLRRRAAYQGSGVLDPLTRLVMVAEELETLHQSPDRLDEAAGVLREVYGDLKPVLNTVHPDSAYVGDRVRATWEVWEDGNFVEKVTKEGVVTHASVPGKNFISFLDDGTGLTHGPLVHNYEVTERFKPKVED